MIDGKLSLILNYFRYFIQIWPTKVKQKMLEAMFEDKDFSFEKYVAAKYTKKGSKYFSLL